MKKLLLVLVLTLTIVLSGCDANDGSAKCKWITPNSVECNNGTTDIDLYTKDYYTKEEVDAIILELQIEIMELQIEIAILNGEIDGVVK